MNILKTAALCAAMMLPAGVPAQTAAAAGDTQAETPMNWTVGLDYAGFDFEAPAGCYVDKGTSLKVRYPDGSFGMSLSNIEKVGCNQQIAFELCRRQATELGLENASVQRAQYGKCHGAVARGMLNGQEVTVAVLPYDGQETTLVMLASPQHKDWADNVLRTLKR